MIKRMSFIKAKAGLTREQFRHHFETVHVPIGLRLFPMIADYRRNYLTTIIRKPDGSPEQCEYDAVNEIWFKSRADYDAYVAIAAQPENRALLVADEAKFIEPNTIWSFIVDEAIGAGDSAR